MCRLLPRLTRPSPFSGWVGIRIVLFEACSGFTRVTARTLARPPKAAFVTGLRRGRLPGHAARQLPAQSTTRWVEPSSTGDSRLRGAPASWSGTQSKALAQTVRHWLPMALHYVEPWMSERDIEAGERWADAVAGELEASSFGIICVTRQNLVAPWLLFEAGALAKSLQGSVVPLLLDLDYRDITGPLAQFQAKKVDKGGLLEVVQAINGAASTPLPPDRLNDLFEALWPEFERRVAAIPEEHKPLAPARTQSEVLEELISEVRSLGARMWERPYRRDRRDRHYQIMQGIHVAQSISERRREPTSLKLLASLYREGTPWMYEIAMEIYNAARIGRMKEANRLFNILQQTAEVGLGGKFGESPSDEFAILHEIGSVLNQLVPKGRPPTPQSTLPVGTPHPIDVGFNDVLQPTEPRKAD